MDHRPLLLVSHDGWFESLQQWQPQWSWSWPSFTDDDHMLIWGIYARAIGCVFFFAFASLLPQILPLAGSRGISPFVITLRHMHRDFSIHAPHGSGDGWHAVYMVPYRFIQRVAYFPSWFWFTGASDRVLQAYVYGGVIGSIGMIIGGPWYHLCLFVCWSLYLSLDQPLGLWYPWEMALLEMAIYTMFIPQPLFITSSMNIVSRAHPLVAWAFRWLAFRVMLGFGKMKFIGSDSLGVDRNYIKAFLVNQPIPTKLAWYAARVLPSWFFQFALFMMFIFEMILPWGIFGNNLTCGIFAIGIWSLMAGIQATGNFGFFNITTATLAITLLDQSSIIGHLVSPMASWCEWVLFIGMVVCGMVTLIFNSWVTDSWYNWPSFMDIIPDAILSLFRALGSWRVFNAYGVFPPHTLAPLRMALVFEGSCDDGNTWAEYRYRYQISSPTSPPCAIAPFHPRLDHLLFYAAVGIGGADDWTTHFFFSNPYRQSHTRSSMVARICQRLMDPLSPVTNLFISPYVDPDQRPTMVRVRLMSLLPYGYGQGSSTSTPTDDSGQRIWWHREYTSMYLPGTEVDATVWYHYNHSSTPEYWAWESLIWHGRSSSYHTMMRPATQAIKVLQARDTAMIKRERALQTIGDDGSGRTAAEQLRGWYALDEETKSANEPLPDHLTLSSLVAASIGGSNNTDQGRNEVDGTTAVTAFWDLIHHINDECTPDTRWSSLPSMTSRLSIQCPAATWNGMERVLWRLTHYLAARIEPHMPPIRYGPRKRVAAHQPMIRTLESEHDDETGQATTASVNVMMNNRWCLLMLCHHIILYGRTITELVWSRSNIIPSQVALLTQSRGLYLSALFHYDTFVTMSRNRRITHCVTARRMLSSRLFPGIFHHMETLAAQEHILSLGREHLAIMVPPTRTCYDWRIITQAAHNHTHTRNTRTTNTNTNTETPSASS